jgi:hypothetical protein
MHSDFPRWYREVGLEDNRDRLQRRWIGLCALIKKLDATGVESMIGLLIHTKHTPSGQNLDLIRKPFRDADDLFDMGGNDRELEILSGATLAVLFEKGNDLAARAALKVTTAAFGGARVFNLPMDLGELAEQAIASIAEIRRRRPKLSRFASDDTVKAYLKESVAADQGEEIPNRGLAPIGLVTDFITETNAFIAVQDEELQILWWLFGERSHDQDVPFSVVPDEARPLVFAKELADATQFLPGPASARAILSRTGLREKKKMTVPTAVNKCDADWLASLVNHDGSSPVLMPIHFAIRRKLETGDEVSWIEGWGAASGIKPDHALPALTLSNLFYRERLLSQFPKE